MSKRKTLEQLREAAMKRVAFPRDEPARSIAVDYFRSGYGRGHLSAVRRAQRIAKESP